MNMPNIVGILNVTPDSFSDGGQYMLPEAAMSHARELVAQGATVIDVGAESTRPGAITLSAEEEWERIGDVLPLLCKTYKQSDIIISFDSRHAQNAQKAIALGVEWINDVSGAEDERLQQVVAAADETVRLVVMHHLGIPADKEKIMPLDLDIVASIKEWAKEKLDTLEKAGIIRQRIILDPGLGFGKNAKQSLEILKNIEQLQGLGAPLLVGHSRKSFLRPFCGESMAARDEATLVVSAYLCAKNVDYLRVHNVAMHQHGLALATELY